MIFFLCDDDKEALSYYSQKINSICIKHGIDHEIGCYSSGEQLMFNYTGDQKSSLGILFLDIHMPKTDGIAVAQKLKESGFQGEIVFLTVSSNHWQHAFDLQAFNYLVKEEITDSRFEKVLLRAVNSIKKKTQEYILFSAAGEHRNLAVNDIRYFEVTQRIITVYYGDNRFSFFSSMNKIENQLVGRGFVRVHRAFLVAISQITSLAAMEIILRDGTKLPVGRKYLSDIKNALSSFSNFANK